MANQQPADPGALLPPEEGSPIGGHTDSIEIPAEAPVEIPTHEAPVETTAHAEAPVVSIEIPTHAEISAETTAPSEVPHSVQVCSPSEGPTVTITAPDEHRSSAISTKIKPRSESGSRRNTGSIKLDHAIQLRTEVVSRKVNEAWTAVPTIPFRTRTSGNTPGKPRHSATVDSQGLGTRPTRVNSSFGWYKKAGGRTSDAVHAHPAPGTPKALRRSRARSRQVSTALKSAGSRDNSRAVMVPIAGADDQDAYEVKETTIMMHCDDIEVPVTTMWPLSSIAEVRALCEGVFEFLDKYPTYQLECHHRRPYGASSDEQTEILLEIVTGEKEKSTAVSTEMVSYMTAEQLTEMFESSIKQMKIPLLKICLIEIMQRLGALLEEDDGENEEEAGQDTNGDEKPRKSEMKSRKSEARSRKSSRADAKSQKTEQSVEKRAGSLAESSVERNSVGLAKRPRDTQQEIEDAEKIVECIKNLRGELRAVPEALFAWVLSLMYTVVEFISESEDYDCSESEEYFTFALRGFSANQASPFFPQIFTASCDLFMLLCFIGCDAVSVLEAGPAFELLCKQAKTPLGGSLQVAASACECLVVLCRKDEGLEIMLKDRQVWCEWIAHVLQTLKDDEREPQWVYSMAVTALFRLWSIFSHEDDECHYYFKENFEKLPVEFIFMIYNSETFDRENEADIDIITSACSALTGTIVNIETGEVSYRSPEFEAILLDIIQNCHEEPDVIDAVCNCLAIVASKSLIEKSGSSILESILRGVAALWDHPRFITNAFHSLSIFLRTSPALQEILTLEALELIVTVMKENPFNEELQENGLFLFGLISRKVERNRAHLVKCGASQICKIACGQFPENTLIRDHAKYASSALSREPGFLGLW